MELTAARIARLREGTYTAGSHTVYFQDGQTLQDAADLYAILREQSDTGSPNVENDLARAFVEVLQSGGTLDNVQLGKLLDMVKRHGADLAAYRASSDPSRNILDVPDPTTAKIIN